MGTSSSYGGPGKGGSLLPPGTPPADVTTTDPLVADNPGLVWPDAKRQMTLFASSGGSTTVRGREHLGAASRYFVRAQGGSGNAARASVSGRATAQKIGGFLSLLATAGPSVAAERFGLADFVGSRAEDLLTAVVDRLAPAGRKLEEAAARAAGEATLAELFRTRGADEGGLDALRSLSAADVQEVMLDYVVRYIEERILQVLAKGLEDRPAAEVVEREVEVRRFIAETVRLDLGSLDVLTMDWQGNRTAVLIERIFREAYDLIGAQ